MTDIALQTKNLGKMYQIGGERQAYRTLRDVLVQTAKRPIERIRHPGAATHSSQELWALRNLDLVVNRGEAVGIIGKNGAGKSTLLKTLSHITEPTEGRVEISGRVASLLEVGTGFHGELTGRENIQLNGAILGMTRSEIRKRFNDIVEFSEIGKFLDTPVKRYSSGMYVRLAFAVAAHIDPEILIVDEVLAVGDQAFQRKCLGKMRDVAGHGRTVLFVSHNLSAVLTLCSRAVQLDGGRLVADGLPSEIVSKYIAGTENGSSSMHWQENEAPGDDVARVLAVEICQEGHAVNGQTRSSLPIEVAIRLRIDRSLPRLKVHLELFDSDGYQLFESANTDVESGDRLMEGFNEVSCFIPGKLLNEGHYMLRLLVSLHDDRWIVGRDNDVGVQFDVILDHAQTAFWHAPRRGRLAPQLEWQVFRAPDCDED